MADLERHPVRSADPQPGNATPAQRAPADPRARILALQRSAGNRAVTRMLQRQHAPVVSQRGEDVLDDFDALWKRAGWANQANASVWRSDFLSRLQTELGPEVERLAAALSQNTHPSQAGLDLDAIEAKLDRFNEELWTEHESARVVWAELQEEVAAERRRLGDQGDFAAVEALRVLDAQLAETARIVTAVGSSLVSEDLVALDDMLRRDKHVKLGELRGGKEERAAEADLATAEAEDEEDSRDLDDDDSVLRTAWDVLGWDSVGEFAADVALSIITFGVAKYLRVAAKGAKAARRAQRIRELRRILKARRAARAKRRLEKAKLALTLFRGDARSALVEQLAWLRGNWPKIARKFTTDLVAMTARGSVDNLPTTAARRAAKELLNARVMEFLGKDDKHERRVIRLAWASQLAGHDDRARKLGHVYLLLNVRRRLLVNALYYTAIEGGRLSLPTDRDTLKKIGIATVGEVLQDVVLAVPFLDKPVVKDAVEAVRKYLVKEVEGIIAQ